MDRTTLFFCGIQLFGVFIASVAQVLLKKAALKHHQKLIYEYINFYVVIAYLMLFVTTFLSIYAYRGLPLSFAVVLGSSSYIFVTFWGVVIFHERLGLQRLMGLILVLIGVISYGL